MFIMETIITGCLTIWDQRNKFIFNHIDPEITTCIMRFKTYFSIIMHTAKPSLKEGMQSWLDTLWTPTCNILLVFI
jgi:hypothetical protein